MEDCDLIIKGKYLLSMDDKSTVIREGAVAVKGKKIAALGRAKDVESSFKTKETINSKNSIIMPGLINTHTHAAMSYFRGLADDLPLQTWLEKYIWPAEAKYVKPEFVKNASELACLEMAKAGITFFNDMYFFSSITAEVCRQAGLRALLSDAIIDFPAPSYKNVDEALCLLEELCKKYKNDEFINISAQPHSIYACSGNTLIRIKEMASKYDLPIHIHVSETSREVKNSQEKYGKSPVEYLDSLGLLSGKTIAAHSVWLDDKDLEIYKKRNVKVSHNPVSNMKLSSGVAPVRKMQEMKIAVGLGTDSVASNNSLDIFSDMKVCALLHKINSQDPTALKAGEIVEMATINAAKVVGMEKEIGSLEAGKKADIITINLNKPHLIPIYDLYSHLVYCANSSDVENVIVNGKILVKNREAKTMDEEKILKKANKFNIKKELTQ